MARWLKAAAALSLAIFCAAELRLYGQSDSPSAAALRLIDPGRMDQLLHVVESDLTQLSDISVSYVDPNNLESLLDAVEDDLGRLSFVSVYTIDPGNLDRLLVAAEHELEQLSGVNVLSRPASPPPTDPMPGTVD